MQQFNNTKYITMVKASPVEILQGIDCFKCTD